MRKLLCALMLVVPALSFADDGQVNMADLKCGSGSRLMQIYSDTTLAEVRTNCLAYKQFPIAATYSLDEPKGAVYEVQFYSTEPKDAFIRCDFNGTDPSSVVIGCRSYDAEYSLKSKS